LIDIIHLSYIVRYIHA